MRILVIDNYDSFTFNLVHRLESDSNVHTTVLRCDALGALHTSGWDRVVLSPGPGLPSESGDLMKALDYLSQTNIPVLGVCLGWQAMAEFSGGTLYNLGTVRHGTGFPATIDTKHPLFAGLEAKAEVGLYHSWAVDPERLPECWHVIAQSHDGVIMAAEHCNLPWLGLQFHPESILTPSGSEIIRNWLKIPCQS